MTIDIIIPVHNRVAALIDTLKSLNTQSVLSEVTPRLIIIDDGSIENIGNAVKAITSQFANPWLPPIILNQPHKGAATARNLGLQAATADIILFLGADIMLRPDTLQHHIEFHLQHPAKEAGALGFVMWNPALKPNPFMEWMVHGGPQNDFDALLGKTQADPNHFFYASHLSLKRAMVSRLSFDEQFSTYGWEDLDFGRQLAAQGFSLYLLHRAIGYHNHVYNLNTIKQRQLATGASFALYSHKYAPLRQSINLGISRRVKHALAAYLGFFTLIQGLISHWPNHSFPKLFSCLTTHWFLQGFWRHKGHNQSL